MQSILRPSAALFDQSYVALQFNAATFGDRQECASLIHAGGVLDDVRFELRGVRCGLPTILELDSVPAGGLSLVHGSSVIWQIGSC
jgi:hypothetical protein